MKPAVLLSMSKELRQKGAGSLIKELRETEKRVQKKFEWFDWRFEQIDERFEQVDRKLKQIYEIIRVQKN